VLAIVAKLADFSRWIKLMIRPTSREAISVGRLVLEFSEWASPLDERSATTCETPWVWPLMVLAVKQFRCGDVKARLVDGPRFLPVNLSRYL
jgi:hypothetical protein